MFKRNLLPIVLCLLVLVSVPARAAHHELDVFGGSVQTAGPDRVFNVVLYKGDANAPAFEQTRMRLTSAQTDGHGNFILTAYDLAPGSTVTIRAVNSVLHRGGQSVVKVSDDRINRVAISVKPVPDVYYGISLNRYATSTIYFITDRAHSGTAFANKRSDPLAPVFGHFQGNVSMGTLSTTNGRCQFAVEWSCTGKALKNDDAFASDVAITQDGMSGSRGAVEATLQAAASENKAVLFFVHGYNNSFMQAAAAASKLSFLAEPMPHVTLLYSWPSTQALLGYIDDRTNSEASADNDLLPILDELAKLHGRTKVVLVAHSMGVHALTRALNDWANLHGEASGVFDQLILFAGDEDYDSWNAHSSGIERIVGRVEIFSNRDDEALYLSQCTGGDGQQRVGQRTNWPKSIVAFDATPFAPYDDFGHGYLTRSTTVVAQYNEDINGTSPADLKVDLHGLPWLGDRGGAVINMGAAEAHVLCAAARHLGFP